MDSVLVQCMLYKLASLLYLNTFLPLLVKDWLMKPEVMRKGQFPSYLKVIIVHYSKFPRVLTKWYLRIQVSKESQVVILILVSLWKVVLYSCLSFLFFFFSPVSLILLFFFLICIHVALICVKIPSITVASFYCLIKTRSHRHTPKSIQFTVTQHQVLWNRGKSQWVWDKYSLVAEFLFWILLIVLIAAAVHLLLC